MEKIIAPLYWYKDFSFLTAEAIKKINALPAHYDFWNNQINVISRKDQDKIWEHHIIHSLVLGNLIPKTKGLRVLDLGTGGGFPGIPLAIAFPEMEFILVDSVGKKIKVVEEVSAALGLKNLKAAHIRAEKVKGEFDFIVSRAVTTMPDFVKWVRKKVAKKQQHTLRNGILYLKGGDLTEELSLYSSASLYELAAFFEEDFFETKKVVHLPLKYKP